MFELEVVTGESLERFVPRWYGMPDRPVPTRLLPPGLPPPLVTWYGLAGRYSLPLSRDHEFLPADALEADGDKKVFWKSARDAYGFQSGTDDPMVHERADNTWLPTGEPLHRFLVYVAVYEAVYAPIHGLVGLAVPGELVEPVLRRLDRLDDPLWEWPGDGLSFYADDDLIAHAEPDGGRLVLAARHRDALGRFDGYEIPWDWDSRVDG